MERKIDVLAKEQFEGKYGAAIGYIFENHQSYNCDEYYSEFTDAEKRLTSNILYNMAIEKQGKETFNIAPEYYLREIKRTVLPITFSQEQTLTKEKVWDEVLMYKTNTRDFIMKFGFFLSIFTYIFAIPISFLTDNFLILLYPVPILIALFILFYIIKLWNINAIKKEKKQGFTIKKAICTSVISNSGYDEGSSIKSNEVYFCGYIRYTDYDLFIKEGEAYYLISVDGKIKAVFLASDWRLDLELSNMLK